MVLSPTGWTGFWLVEGCLSCLTQYGKQASFVRAFATFSLGQAGIGIDIDYCRLNDTRGD